MAHLVVQFILLMPVLMTEGSLQPHQQSAKNLGTPSPRKNNPVFDLLAGERNDIEGLAAYALYKRHKRGWADTIRAEGREPTADDDMAFARTAATSDQLDRYRKDAQDILIAFATEFVDRERASIIQTALADRAERAFSKIEDSGSILSLIRAGVASTLITAILLAALAYSVRLFGIDLVDAVRPMLENRAPAPTTPASDSQPLPTGQPAALP